MIPNYSMIPADTSITDGLVFLNHQDRLFCDVFETPNNNNNYFTIITIIGLTIIRSDASPKSRCVRNNTDSKDTHVLMRTKGWRHLEHGVQQQLQVHDQRVSVVHANGS